jgi:hypothetical protein
LLAAVLTIRNAIAVDADEGWGDMGMLLDLQFDADAGRVLVESSGFMRVSVAALDAEAHITSEIDGYARVFVDKVLGGEWNKTRTE